MYKIFIIEFWKTNIEEVVNRTSNKGFIPVTVFRDKKVLYAKFAETEEKMHRLITDLTFYCDTSETRMQFAVYEYN